MSITTIKVSICDSIASNYHTKLSREIKISISESRVSNSKTKANI